MTAMGFWTGVLYVGLAGYFGLAVVVTVGGWFDIRAMLRRLSAKDGRGGSFGDVVDGGEPIRAGRPEDQAFSTEEPGGPVG